MRLHESVTSSNWVKKSCKSLVRPEKDGVSLEMQPGMAQKPVVVVDIVVVIVLALDEEDMH